MGGRALTCVILAFLAVGVNCGNGNNDSKPASDAKNICKLCKCEDSKVDCFDQSITTFFTEQEWAAIEDFQPKEVDLSENRFINVTFMADLTVEVLNLSRCSIESIKPASFRGLQNMKVLDLSYNLLTTEHLGPQVFEGRYSPEGFKLLESLRILNLAFNDLHSLHQDLFEHTPELLELDLSGNPLTILNQVTIIAISSLPVLKVLRMRSCQLKTIPDKFLHTPKYLEHLDISDNLLTAVPQALEEVKDLVYLNLNQNPIVELDLISEDYPGFPRLRKLEELHMCNMKKLRRIGAGALSGLETVQKLRISFNPSLSFIDPMALARTGDIFGTYEWPLVKELYLQSNNLSEVDTRLLSRWDLLEKVDVSDNPFLCDCSTQWMVDVLVPTVDKRFGKSSLMVCREPIEMRGYTLKHLHDIHRTMHCVDKNGHRPEKDGAILHHQHNIHHHNRITRRTTSTAEHRFPPIDFQ